MAGQLLSLADILENCAVDHCRLWQVSFCSTWIVQQFFF